MNLDFLNNLLLSHSPSGYETASTEVFSLELEKAGARFEFRDSIGNCAYSVGNGEIPFMLSGHIDQVGLQVQYIDEKGFVYFIKAGGTDPKILPGSSVVIMSNDGPVNGIIGKSPIHIEWNSEEKDKAIKLKDLKIDIGASNKEEALSMVQIGNPIVIGHPTLFMGKYRIASGGIDDKVGVFITAEVLKLLQKDYELEATAKEVAIAEGRCGLRRLKVYGVACTQEEVGGHGAVIAAKRINPQYSIDYDVTFATDDDCVSAKEWGDIKLGEGGCIAHGPDKHVEMCNGVSAACKKHGIPHQEFSVGAGMTNTCKIKLNSDDCKTLLLSIPERNMHTPVEVCDLRDIESLIQMTYWYLHELDKIV